MSNPTQTNTGASAYLGFLATLAGNPEVLKDEHLNQETLKNDLVSLFSGVERSSGSDEFLEEMFLNGNYESVVSYESTIININKQLENNDKEPLYLLYPVDGVSISDSPFAYIKGENPAKRETFLKLQDYILSEEGQSKLAETGRRTWFGGITDKANPAVFNPNWGINTEKYIVPIKYPSVTVIRQALNLYQSELRKPQHIIFGLDYSGSMQGTGHRQLVDAMKYILDKDQASKDLLQFTEKDKITVIPFNRKVIEVWQVKNGENTDTLVKNIENLVPNGSTNIYDTAIQGLNILAQEDFGIYNVSIIIMTDGQSNVGTFESFAQRYDNIGLDIPVYSILFGEAYERELRDIASKTNGKVFDGKNNLLEAFKEVRGYN